MVFATQLAEPAPRNRARFPLNAKILQVMQVKHAVVLSVLLMLTTLLNAQCIRGDCTQGNGVFVFPSGDMYTGTWEAASMQGYGRYDWSGGAWYVGSFYQNQMQGKGAFCGADGRQMVGLFEANIYIGPDSNAKTYPVFNPALSAEQDWNELKRQDSVARTNTLATAKEMPICEAINLLFRDFENRFATYLGEPRAISLGRYNRYYANLIPIGGSAAVIGLAEADSGRWYTVKLFESADSAQAWTQFGLLRTQINACSITNCQMQAQLVNAGSAERPMQSVVWLPDALCLQQYPKMGSNITMQLTCTSSADATGWEVIFTMSD